MERDAGPKPMQIRSYGGPSMQLLVRIVNVVDQLVEWFRYPLVLDPRTILICRYVGGRG
jgi:hypothetical protein